MSHHFDIKLAREDPSLNLCDFYLFDGPSGKTVMAMTVNCLLLPQERPFGAWVWKVAKGHQET